MNVSLRFTHRFDGRDLVIAWTFANRESAELGVFNLIEVVRPDGTLSFSPEVAWVELDEGVLTVSQRALAAPPDLAMAARVPPYCSRFAASADSEGEVRVPLPLRVMHTYRRAALGGQVVADVPREASVLRFAMGVFPLDDRCRLAAEQPAFPEVFSALPPGAALARQEIVSAEIALAHPLTVLDYRSVPWA